MKRWAMIFLALVSVLTWADPDLEQKQALVDRFVWNSVAPFSGKTVEELRSYQIVLREEEAPYVDPNRGPDAGAMARALWFAGIELSGFDFPNEEFFIERVEITTPTFALAGGLRVGSTLEELLRQLPYPAERSADTLTYHGETETAEFHVTNGLVSKVVLVLYTG